MPQIIVTADRASKGLDPVMLRERINVEDFESERFALNLLERLGWAVLDAAEFERAHPAVPADSAERAAHPAALADSADRVRHPAALADSSDRAPHPAALTHRTGRAPHPAASTDSAEPHPAERTHQAPPDGCGSSQARSAPLPGHRAARESRPEPGRTAQRRSASVLTTAS